MDFQAIFQEWLTTFLIFFPKLVAGIVIFIVGLVSAGFIAKAVRRVAARRIKTPEVLKVIGQIAQWTVVIIGTIIALDMVEFNVTGFIAGLGIVGFTIGFALQDIARNFISGLILLYRQPFSIGDFIEVGGYSGTVRMINIRDTEVETLDGDFMIIPNNKITENPIINATTARLRRRSVAIGLGLKEDVDHAMQIFLEAIQAVAGVEADPAPMIQAMSMGESALSLTAFYWVDQQQNSPLFVHTAVLKAVNSAVQAHHIDLPYPTQTVFVQQAGIADRG